MIDTSNNNYQRLVVEINQSIKRASKRLLLSLNYYYLPVTLANIVESSVTSSFIGSTTA